MPTIRLGATVGGAHVDLDLPRLLASRMMLTANSGAGKSWALRRLLEQSHGQVQHLVIDPEGEFHTLREKHDYVLAAASGGDTLAHPKTASLLARRLLELQVSAILDIYELKADERITFVSLFLESLVNAPRALWHPTIVVVDEAHVFAPEIGSVASSGAVIDLMARGRKRELCGVLATQRLSKLKKDAAAEANIKMIGRCSLDLDMKRAGEELGFPKPEWARLRHLPAGRFFAYGPGLSEPVIEVDVGPVFTTHPKLGQRAVPVPAPPARVRKILEQLSDLPKEAEAERQTLEALRAEVARLQQEFAAQPAQPEPVVERVEVAVLTDEDRARIDRLQAQIGAVREEAKAVFDRLLEAQKIAMAPQHRVESVSPNGHNVSPRAPLVPRMERIGAETRRQAATTRREGGAVADAGRRFGKAETAVLNVLAQFPEGCGREKIALLAGYRWTGGFRNTLAGLRTAGYIVGDNQATMRITQAGREALGDAFRPLPRGRELLRYWLSHPLWGKGERAIMEALRDRGPMSGEEIASATGYGWTGGFRNYLAALRTAGIIVGKNAEAIRLHPDLG